MRYALLGRTFAPARAGCPASTPPLLGCRLLLHLWLADAMRLTPGIPVGCSFQDPELLDAALQAVVAAGGAPRPISWGELVRHLNESHLSALLYDMTPCDRRSLNILSVVRERCPWMPILLYVVPTESALAIIPLVQSMGNVRVLAQSLVSSEHTKFVNEVRQCIDHVPINVVAGLIMAIIPSTTPDVQSYLFSALKALEEDGALRVSNVAGSLNVSLRTLQRSLKQRRLPCPKELLDWLMLTYSALVSQLAGVPVSRTIHYFGLTSHDLYRLRARLGLKARNVHLNGADRELPVVVRAFAKRCGTADANLDELCLQLISV